MKTFGRGLLVLSALLAAGGPTAAGSKPDGTANFARANYFAAAVRARPLAERGNPQAQALLGFMYEYGRGVPQDYTTAVYWYRCAAEQDYSTAQYLLGLMYEKGLGVERSDTLAYAWLNLAAAHAPPPAKEYYTRIRNTIAAKLTAVQIANAQWLALRFIPSARR